MQGTRGGLSAFYWLMAAQALAYIELLRFYLRAIGTWPDVGSNFLGYWVLAVLPCSAAFVAFVTWLYRRWIGSRSGSRVLFLIVVLGLDLILLFGSFALYAAKLHR
jgi:hypothetical protein